MAQYLKYFTTVGDEKGQGTNEEEELHEASEELGPATGEYPTELTLRDSFKRLYSSERFQVFHYLSIALLTFFMVELAGKLYAFCLEFFQHRFEVFDGAVVVVSFVLDIVFISNEDSFDGMGLLILLRLWRVARILNGILVSVKTRADQRLHKLKQSYDHLVHRVTELQERNDELERVNSRQTAIL
ncbi:voltage-gated hydrogen channel 1 isoform X2 [Lampris incognitus]|uniref:voltage-gated hydrogen channel 1 isoform X2 n=1 Tax=Lampris incognitus TaxID=2546036 RepID=UPI0024B5B6D1|nr:voltage-gated hydrogen channel 1 isoform X2 [Lampris incognitus]